ncbi:unnamed protein product [Blepharisma stoltei]|uniref:Uncharacterized protein n=1 Tax=Blepharisma stoltei TaxID=1481888 RepID=A0AAU9JCQ3_9CILI|nr:unnamed protein product [Blepharisma stoltei]
MGNCWKARKSGDSKKYEEEDIPTLRPDGIQLPCDDFITGLQKGVEDDIWILGQEFLISIYKEWAIFRSWETQERVKTLCSKDGIVACGGKSIEIFNENGNSIGKLLGHERPVNALALSNNLAISGSGDWSLRLWDLNSQQEIDKNIINWNVITSVKWVPQEPLVIQTSEDLRLRIWDLRERKILRSSVISVGDNFATCCDVKGDYIVTGHRGFDSQGCEAKIWDRRKNEELKTLKGHEQAVESVKFIGDTIFSCGKDGKINQFRLDGDLIDTWTNPLPKPLVSMELYKSGILIANIDPKVMYFTINPLFKAL